MVFLKFFFTEKIDVSNLVHGQGQVRITAEMKGSSQVYGTRNNKTNETEAVQQSFE